MDKYEYRVKLAQIEKLVTKKDYVTAAKIADGIDWRKVKSVTTLSMIADIYEATDRLEDCYEILNMVYDRSPIGRGVVYRLAEIATKMHDFEEAIDLYKEFVRIAPHDLSKYILKYQIYRERGSSVEDQIVILEEFKSHEYDEKWAYELACLYEEAGMIDRCIEECDELILWFSEGEYVVKAMELKMKYQALTASQQEKYEHRFDHAESAEDEEEFQIEAETEEKNSPEEDIAEEAVLKEPLTEKAQTEETQTEEAVSVNEENRDNADDTPQVPVVNMNKFNTLNLQEELAKGLQMILEQADEEENTASKAAEEVIETEEPAKTEQAEERTEEKPQNKELSDTAELQTEILKYAVVPKTPKMEELFCTEEDGQISIAISEESALEKQITGQMTIGEILEAWEEKKRQAREKMEASGEKKTPVLFETGEISELLQDFIPRTPKDVQQIIEEIETETEEPEKAKSEEAKSGEASEDPKEAIKPEDPEKVTGQEDTEEVFEVREPSEAEAEQPEEEMPEEAQLEDDLPQEIDSEEEPKKEALGHHTASMLDAIERALALEITPAETAGKYLTEEQEKIFAYFTSVSGMKKQLAALLSEDGIYAGREDSKEGNLIITGHPGNGKTTLAIDIVKAFQKQRREKGSKLAKVTGDGFNKKNPEDVVKRLEGGALIIEHAGSLNDETVEKLSDVMEGVTGGLLVILEDDSAEITRLLEKNKRFGAKFNRSIDIPIFSNDELVAFGKSYAEEQEYYFDEMAVLALYDCIGVRQTANHVVNIAEVKEIVDDAIAYAEKRSRSIFARLSKKRIDEYGNKLLLEEDFDD